MTEPSPESTPLGVENVAMVHADRARASTTFERLGFRLTPEGRYRLGGAEPRLPVGLCSRHALFSRGGYWEIVTVEHTDRTNLGYDELLARRGSHLAKLTLRLADPAAEAARLKALGVAVGGPVGIRRSLELTGGRTVNVDMQLLVYPPEWTEAWLHSSLVHLERDCNYIPELLEHPNGVLAIEGVIVSAPDVAKSLDRLTAFGGRSPEPGDPPTFRFGDGTRIEVWDEPSADAQLPVTTPGGNERLHAVAFSVESLDALGAYLDGQGVPYAVRDGQLAVAGSEAEGVNLLFEPWHRS